MSHAPCGRCGLAGAACFTHVCPPHDLTSTPKTPFIGGFSTHYEGAALNVYYEWLLAEARWWAGRCVDSLYFDAEGFAAADLAEDLPKDARGSFVFPWESQKVAAS